MPVILSPEGCYIYFVAVKFNFQKTLHEGCEVINPITAVKISSLCGEYRSLSRSHKLLSVCEIIHLSFFSLLLPGLCPFPWRKIPQLLASRLAQDPYTCYFQVLFPFCATWDTAQFWSSPLHLLLTQAWPAWIKNESILSGFSHVSLLGQKEKDVPHFKARVPPAFHDLTHTHFVSGPHCVPLAVQE